MIMRITQVSTHTTQLTRSAILFPVNCYLVREDDGFTLIDTGMPGGAAAYIAAAERLGAPIARIALTHGHGDHIGSLAALRAALPDVPILIAAREARILAGDRALEAGEAQGPIRGSYPRTTLRPTRAIQPGKRVGSLEVIAAPGHTPGQVAFFDPRDGLLLAGDAFSTHTGIAVAGIARPLFPFVKMGTWDVSTAIQTARRLREHQPAYLAVGHGRTLADPSAAMERAIAEAERKSSAAQRHAA
jgi:glyoxylase-like metal-dependent hydrolase (beta-lactamase superfamily II)